MTEEELKQSLDKFLRRFEPHLLTDKHTLPEGFREKLSRQITGIRIYIEDIQGKVKLGQHRSTADQLKVLNSLRDQGPEGLIYADFVKKWLGKPLGK